MNRTKRVLTDTVPIQTIRALHPAPARRSRPSTSGYGWHHGATQPVPVVARPRDGRMRSLARSIAGHVRRIAAQLTSSDTFTESPAQQRALEHLAIHRVLGR